MADNYMYGDNPDTVDWSQYDPNNPGRTTTQPVPGPSGGGQPISTPYNYRDWESVKNGDVNRAWQDWSARTGSQDRGQFTADTGLTYTAPTDKPYSPTPTAPGPYTQPATATQPAGQPAAWMPGDWKNWNTEERWTNLLKHGGVATQAPGSFGFNSGQSPAQLVQQYNTLYGGQARVVASPSGDMVDFGDGRGPVDIRRANGEYWYDVGQRAIPGVTGGGGPSAPGAGGAPGNLQNDNVGNGVVIGGSVGAGQASSPMVQALLDRLMQRGMAEPNTDPNNPVIRNQVDAFRAEQERAQRNQLADLAERSGPYSNLRSEQRLAAETTGQNVSAFQANLIGQELQAQRAQITDALHQLGDTLTKEQQLELTQRLAEIDDATRRLGLSNQYDLGLQGLGLQGEQQANYWDAVRSGLLS